MFEIKSPDDLEKRAKIGRLNFPTAAAALLLLLSLLSLPAMKFNRSQENLFFGIFLVSGAAASVFGVVILVWCFWNRNQFRAAGVENYFWRTILFGFVAFTSPVWLMIVSLFVSGFNR
jgi:hypothetical protein